MATSFINFLQLLQGQGSLSRHSVYLVCLVSEDFRTVIYVLTHFRGSLLDLTIQFGY